MCALCNKYIHKCCSDLTGKEFKQKSEHKFWHCRLCNDDISLPFNHIAEENKYLLELYRFFENEIIHIIEDRIKNRFEYRSFDPTIFFN